MVAGRGPGATFGANGYRDVKYQMAPPTIVIMMSAANAPEHATTLLDDRR
jgi:hypothetical protein